MAESIHLLVSPEFDDQAGVDGVGGGPVPGADSAPVAPGGGVGRIYQLQPRLPARPSVIERALAVATLFVLGHQTPNSWLLLPEEVTVTSSNNLYVILVGVLMVSGVMRVGGYLNLMTTTIKLDVALIAFVVLALISWIWSANPVETLTSAALFTMISLYAMYLVIRFSLEECVTILATTFTLSAVTNLVFVLLFPVYGIMEDGEWSGVFATKNQLGYLTALALPTLLVAAKANVRARLPYLLAAGLFIYLLIMSQSTTSLVATGLGVICLLAFRSFRAHYTLRGASMLTVIGGAVLMVAVATNQIELVAGWVGKDPSLTGRTPLWLATLDVIMDRPILGYGFQAAFGGYFSPTHDVWVLNTWEPPDSHNALLQIWIEVGLIGVVLFLIVLFRAFFNGIRIAAIVPGALGLWPLTIFSLALVTGVSESGIQSEQLGWAIFMIAVFCTNGHLAFRSASGYSNDIREAIAANKNRTLYR